MSKKEPIIVGAEQYAEIERLHKSAESRVISSPTKYVLLGLGAFGLLVNPLGAPAAVAVAFPFAYAAIKRAIQNGENAAYMRNTGIFAHLLSERELVKLTRLVSREVVTSQLQEALEDDKPLSSAALDYLEYAGVGTEPITLKTLLQGKQPKQISGEVISSTAAPGTDHKPEIKTQIRLGTIEVPAQTLYGGNWQATPTTQTQPTDLALQIAQHLTSRIVCAAPRTGKGLLIFNALEYLRKLRPDCELWALDIKADPGENGYYKGIAPDKLLRLNLMGFDKPEGADQRIAAFFRAFNSSVALTKLLWLNETVTLAAKLDPKLWKNIQDFAVGLCSAGATGNEGQTGRFLWVDTQSPNVTDIGLRTNAARNVFRRVFLINHDRSLLPSAVSSGFASSPSDAELADLQATGSKVLAFDSFSNKWIALPNCSPPSPHVETPSVSAVQQPVTVPVHVVQTLFDELASSYQKSATLPQMSDFILWLKTKQGEAVTKRDSIRLWGSKKEREITTNEKIEPFFNEAIALGLVTEMEGSYTVINV